MKKNKYELIIQNTIDLHGLSLGEALIAVESFITESQQKKHTMICIITGKGIHSPSGPVLKKNIQIFLREQGISFRDAKIQEGGSGALIVTLS